MQTLAVVGGASMLIAWMLVTFGVTIVITKSRIGAPLRRRFPIRTTDGSGPDDKRVTVAHLLRCPMCTGWWVGAALSLLHIRVLQDAFWAPSSPGMFIAQEAELAIQRLRRGYLVLGLLGRPGRAGGRTAVRCRGSSSAACRSRTARRSGA